MKLNADTVARGTNFQKYKWLLKYLCTFWRYSKVIFVGYKPNLLKDMAKEKNMFIGQLLEVLFTNYSKDTMDNDKYEN